METKQKEDVVTDNLKEQVDLVRIITKREKKDMPSSFNLDLLMHSIVCATARAIRKNDTSTIKKILNWDSGTESDFKKIILKTRTDLLFAHFPENVKKLN